MNRVALLKSNDLEDLVREIHQGRTGCEIANTDEGMAHIAVPKIGRLQQGDDFASANAAKIVGRKSDAHQHLIRRLQAGRAVSAKAAALEFQHIALRRKRRQRHDVEQIALRIELLGGCELAFKESIVDGIVDHERRKLSVV